MIFDKALTQAHRYVRSNSNTICSGMAIAGVLTTSYLTARATWDARGVLDRKPQDIDRKEAVSHVWRLYIPAAVSGVVTVSFVVAAQKAGTRRTVAAQAAFGVSERAFTEYREKVVEKIGENKERALRDEIAQDRITKNPAGTVIVAGSGDVLCYESYTGRYFRSSTEELKKGLNEVNRKVNTHGRAFLSDFYDEVGLPHTNQAFLMGWEEKLMDLIFSTALAEDGNPCITFEYNYIEPF